MLRKIFVFLLLMLVALGILVGFREQLSQTYASWFLDAHTSPVERPEGKGLSKEFEKGPASSTESARMETAWATPSPSQAGETPSSAAADIQVGAAIPQAPSRYHLWVDANTGEDAHRGDSSEQALRTIQTAADLAIAGTTIHIMPGIYREGIVPASSGTASERITYIAENGPGTVILRGSEPASSLTWSRLTSNSIGLRAGIDPANIYYTDLSSWNLTEPPRFIVELDINGDVVNRLMPAREPDWEAVTEWKYHEYWWAANGGSAVAGCDPTTDSNYHCDLPWRSYTQLTDTANDADPPGIEPGNLKTLGNLTGATLVAMDAQHALYVYQRTIVNHAVSSGRITVDEDCDNGGSPGLGWGSKYYVENHPALIDRPGEWWFDINSGRLYLWSPTGIKPSNLNIEISRQETAFDLQNRSYITVDGLVVEFYNGEIYTIEHPNSDFMAYGDVIRNTTLRYADQGVVLYQYISEDTPLINAIDGFLLENSEIGYMDTEGIDSSFWWTDGPTPTHFTHSGIRNTTIQNNELHHLGFNSYHRSAVGIRVYFPDRLRFEGNYIHHVAQLGAHLHLSLIESDKEYDFDPQEIKLGEILIKDNVFEKTCQNAGDCGALKFGGGNRPDTHVFRDVLVTGNVFRDTFGWSHVTEKRTGNAIGDGIGLYVDYASGIHAYRNIAYNNTGAGFKLSCLWRDGTIILMNNIAANNYLAGFKFSDDSGSCDDHNGSVDTQVTNNILVNNEAFGFIFDSAYEQDNYGNLIVDHNLYYSNGWNPEAAWDPANIQLHQGSQDTQYFHDLNEIRSGTPWESHGVESNPGFYEYAFTDRDRYDNSWPDFHITADSTNTLNRGTADLPASLTQLLGIFGVNDFRFGGAFDVGRYEAPGIQVLPTTAAIQPGKNARFILEIFPPSFPSSLNLSVLCPSPDLTCDLEKSSINPGEEVALIVTDHHDPGAYIIPGLWYTITISASHESAWQDKEIRVMVGGEKYYIPFLGR